MRIPRIYQNLELNSGDQVRLDDQAVVHVSRVLRLKTGSQLIIFNGKGGEYSGVISVIDKRSVVVDLQTFHERETESPLKTTLIQGVSRSDRMDFTVQKTTELGVTEILPVVMRYSSVNLDLKRLRKKQIHWQNVANSACEQCGRNVIPRVAAVQSFEEWMSGFDHAENSVKIVLHGGGDMSIRDVSLSQNKKLYMFVGPEGGISDDELQQLKNRGFRRVKLGPRTLRTETAAIAAMSVLQYLQGDFAG